MHPAGPLPSYLLSLYLLECRRHPGIFLSHPRQPRTGAPTLGPKTDLVSVLKQWFLAKCLRGLKNGICFLVWEIPPVTLQRTTLKLGLLK